MPLRIFSRKPAARKEKAAPTPRPPVAERTFVPADHIRLDDDLCRRLLQLERYGHIASQRTRLNHSPHFEEVYQKALERIDNGTFGICEECDEPISIKRLEARPETTLCIRCKEDQERVERDFG